MKKNQSGRKYKFSGSSIEKNWEKDLEKRGVLKSKPTGVPDFARIGEVITMSEPIKQEGWEMKMDNLVIDFFDKIYPLKKGEAHTWLIPLMVELKVMAEDLIAEAEKRGAKYWENEAKRYCKNANFWRDKSIEARKEVIEEIEKWVEDNKFSDGEIDAKDLLFKLKELKK